jgi:hypothetical protein
MIDWFRRGPPFSIDATSYRVNPPIPAGSGHAMNGCSESISDKPVLRPIAEDIDPSESLDERIALKAPSEVSFRSICDFSVELGALGDGGFSASLVP